MECCPHGQCLFLKHPSRSYQGPVLFHSTSYGVTAESTVESLPLWNFLPCRRKTAHKYISSHTRHEAMSATEKTKQESGIESPGVKWSLFCIGCSLIRALTLIVGMPQGISKQHVSTLTALTQSRSGCAVSRDLNG